MSIHIEHQIIKEHGKPAFAVIPYDKFVELTKSLEKEEEEVRIPHEIVQAHIIQGLSMIRAWREYLGLTQKEVANKAGMSQPAYAKLEKTDARPRMATLKKVAGAMRIPVEQLMED